MILAYIYPGLVDGYRFNGKTLRRRGDLKLTSDRVKKALVDKAISRSISSSLVQRAAMTSTLMNCLVALALLPGAFADITLVTFDGAAGTTFTFKELNDPVSGSVWRPLTMFERSLFAAPGGTVVIVVGGR